MGMTTPTGLFPRFETLAANPQIVKGVMFDLGNMPDDYLAGKILAPVVFPPSDRPNEMEIDGRALHGKILRKNLWGSYGVAQSSTVAFGQRAIPVEGQDIDPLDFNGKKYFNSYAIEVEKLAEIEEWGIEAFRDMMEIPRTQVLVNREAEWASLFGTVANWDNTTAVTTPWNQAGSTPIQDIQAMRTDIAKFGTPDTIIMSEVVANALAANEAFNSPRQMTVDRAILTNDQLAEILQARFGLRVHIASAKAETSRDPANPSPQYIWGNTVWIGRLDADGGDIRATSGGRVTARRAAAINVVAQNLYADVIGPRINGEHDDTYVARVRMIESLDVVYSQLGGTLTNVIA